MKLTEVFRTNQFIYRLLRIYVVDQNNKYIRRIIKQKYNHRIKLEQDISKIKLMKKEMR